MRDADLSTERFGDYQLLERIGSGGMAEVYRARSEGHAELNRTVVVKKILPQYAQNKAFVQMLIAEARVNAVLQHPNIVQVYELGQHARQFYIAMEYVSGVDLLDVLRCCSAKKIAFPPELALYIVAEVCSGLDHAHHARDLRGRPLRLIHRDVSPSNILLGDLGLVKILDFGVAHADLIHSAHPRVKTQQSSDTVKGKLGYLSPEQVLGQTVDQRADIFALGIVMFELLTLERLFVGASDIQTLMNIRDCRVNQRLEDYPNIPEAIKAILRRSLAADPETRFASAQSFRTAILDHMFDAGLQANARRLSRFLIELGLIDLGDDATSCAFEAQDEVSNDPESLVAGRTLRTLARLQMPFGARWPIGSRDAVLHHLQNGTLGVHETVELGDLPEMTVGSLPEIEPHQFERDGGALLHEIPINPLTLTRIIAQQSLCEEPRRLTLSRPGMRASMVVEGGRLIQVSNPAKALRLGALLLDRQLLTPSALTDAMVEKAATGKRLGAILIERELVSVSKLQEVVNDQLKARFIDLVSWSSGWLQVSTSRPVPLQAVQAEPHQLSPMLLEAIGIHFTASQLRGWLTPHGAQFIVHDPDRIWPELGEPHGRLQGLLRNGESLERVLSRAADSTDERLLMALLFWAHQAELLSLSADPSGRPS